ncbi:DUF4232 domain-containing protein [Streptomyces kebangsaanensis]|uniref:DUF4232 domain-containing protein n=1 Tax=Streptomyces kebangsaanensis TaxID=864058 RepID=UPI00093DD00A|nr:DUF4232 domain-containing protein [Streptomyces kebangsaanensis]
MTHTSPSAHRAALLASAAAVLGLLTACGSGGGTSGAPRQVSGTAAPATGDTTAGTTSGTAPGTDSATNSGAAPPSGATTTGSARGTGGARTTATSTRCHTSELRASVGRDDPGAGQENFPVVLTNTSGRTCTVRGYPGAAFVDAAGRQLGPDPKRSPGTPTAVTLRPGSSAWTGLTFSNPGVSGARTATPAALIVTPPDERDHLTVKWTAGQVPVGGNASSVFLTVLGPGTAP